MLQIHTYYPGHFFSFRGLIGVYAILFGLLVGWFAACQLLNTSNMCGMPACGTSAYKSVCTAQRSLEDAAAGHKPIGETQSDADLPSKPVRVPRRADILPFAPPPTVIAHTLSLVVQHIQLQI